MAGGREVTVVLPTWYVRGFWWLGGGRQTGRREGVKVRGSSRCIRAMSCSYMAATNLGCTSTLSTQRICAVSLLLAIVRKSPIT